MLVVNIFACGPSGRVTACVVYTADSIRDSIRTKKNDSQVPRFGGVPIDKNGTKPLSTDG